MNFHSSETKAELRELIKRLAEKMHAEGDPWLLKGSTTREDSWYNRHLAKMKKNAKTMTENPSSDEKTEKFEKIETSEKSKKPEKPEKPEKKERIVSKPE